MKFKKTDNDDSNKYSTTQEVNKLIAQNLASKHDIAALVKKKDFDHKLRNLNKRFTSNKTKHVLVENEFKNLRIFDPNLFISQNYFFNDGAQLYLIFQTLFYTFKKTR